MACYVDDMRAHYGRMVMCHLVADTTDELLAMAARIGVSSRWMQHPGEPGQHFDIALSKRALAVAAGAIEVTWLDLGRRQMALRRGEHWGPEVREHQEALL